MSEISNIGSTIYPALPYTRGVVGPAFPTPDTRTDVDNAPRPDRVELSRFNSALERAVDKSSLSIARTRAIRAEIANGTYETPARINGTAERLLDVIA